MRRYLGPAGAQLHVVEHGPADGPPLVLLHQTPRSADEYAALAPRLAAAGWRALAVDTPGFGASDPVGEHRIEAYAQRILDALDVERFAVLGHHTGGVVAVELAARAPQRVTALVLSSTPHIDAAARERRAGRRSVDHVEPSSDGSHLVALWRARAAFTPAGLVEPVVRDALRCGPAARDGGHAAVSAYRMEERLPLVACPVLCVGSDADPYAFPDLEPLAAALGAPTAVVAGGTVAVPEQCPDDLAAVALAFLRDPGPDRPGVPASSTRE